MSEAAGRWREQLESWALPEDLLATAEDDPYGWPQALWKRRSEGAAAVDTPTTEAVTHLLGERGTLLDVGAGRGRASLRFVASGHRLVAVEPDPGMAAGLAEDAAGGGAAVEIIQARWPEAAPLVGDVDVALSAHVVYDVPEIGPFVGSLHLVARRGVVIELSESHPWSDLGPLYRSVHGIDRPTGPTYLDLAAVVAETVGVTPAVEVWTRPGQLWFESWDEICDFYGRRLVVPRDERPGLRSLLAERVIEVDGRLVVGGDERRLVTVWWPAGAVRTTR